MRYTHTIGRLQILTRNLIRPSNQYYKTSINVVPIRLCSSSSSKITIGGISKDIKASLHPELVPTKYLKSEDSQDWLRHMRWMLQKDKLGQDIFLIGPPGPLRHTLAMSYLELTNKEVEYVTLTRDTTDSDLKQRREIKGGTSFYHDQSAVRAATEGRVLILEGIEKAERNVLPVLNNLLENREMQLEDGRLLIPAQRYDKLLEVHTEEELSNMKLVRVSEDFRVIALGLPSPPYLGHPLDPPLRSRFQARDISTVPFKEHLEQLIKDHKGVTSEVATRILSYGHSLLAEEAKALSLHDFPISNLSYIMSIMEKFPGTRPENLLSRLYPYQSFMQSDSQSSVNELLTTFNLVPSSTNADKYEVKNVKSNPGESLAEVEVVIDGQHINTKVPCGNSWTGAAPNYVMTSYHDKLLLELLQSHSVRDFAIIGSRGCGKSAAVAKLAHILGYETEPILLYQDMTSRDLVQQRVTTPSGDTAWQFSPLVTAALQGKIAILDGLHRLHHGTLAVLHRLLHDRELHLYDGSRLIRHDRYDAIKEEHKLTEKQLTEGGVLRIHPSFRVIGLAEPPQIGATQGQWLNPESLTLFLYHEMKNLTQQQTSEIVTKVVGQTSPTIAQLITLTGRFCASSDPALQSLGQSLSLRQILRIAKRFQAYPGFDLHTAVYKACLARFLPALAKQTLDTSLEQSNITKPSNVTTANYTCEVKEDVLRIGNTHTTIYKPEVTTKIPQTLFFDIQQHISVLENMLQDWLLGDHLLLVGNQGVGKNKLADRFLYLLNRPREYIQLHRDTTVQSLTIQPTVKDGRIIYEDSPLVSAVMAGHVLVVDEADKAPTNVTCVLKTLVESGEMLLSDGRRIIPPTHPLAGSGSSRVIVTHPDFRMIVLANRPGFPFLGNDFFGALGDLFSCHAIDNPSPESEMALLRSYGPDVPQEIMWKLVSAFGELRDLADQGLIQYPYSTREVVNIVKHLQAFPNEGIASVVRNVFDFDSWAGDAKETLIRVMQQHGIPVGASPNNIDLAKKYPLSPPTVTGTWRIKRQHSGVDKQPSINLEVTSSPINFKNPIYLNVEKDSVSAVQIRSTYFSEQESMWMVPLYETSLITDLVSTTNVDGEDIVYVATISPFCLYFFTPKKGVLFNSIQLHDGHFSLAQGNLARVRVAPLPGDRVAFHEEMSNTLMIVFPESGIVHNISLMSAFEAVSEKIINVFGNREEAPNTSYHMCKDLSDNGQIILWQHGGGHIQCVDLNTNNIYSISCPHKLKSLTALNSKEWLVTNQEGEKFLLSSEDNVIPNLFHPIIEKHESFPPLSHVLHMSDNLSEFVLSTALKQKLSAPSRIVASDKNLAHIIVGFPELDSSDNEIWTFTRQSGLSPKLPVPSISPSATSTVLPEAGQVIRVVDSLPPEVSDNDRNRNVPVSYLEVVDMVSHNLCYIPVSRTVHPSAYWRYAAGRFAAPLLLSRLGKDGLVTVDSAGGLRIWQTGVLGLERALQEWRNMIGFDEGPLRLEKERESGLDVSSPKHGKVDEKNDPHVGGNQWAGGTGGRDTAGLGGKGGPYRLDAGHDVHQIPQFEKDAVPEEVRKAAREMGKKAFQERLREIQMSEYDATLYNKLASKVTTQVKSLRSILNALQARSKERQWLRHRTEGELDDTKLIEGLAGDKNIYRLRREEEPEIGAPQTKPKRLRLLVDLSGSMYRFNGHDGRLERELEVTLMVMEAFEGFEAKFKYDIYGHSGEDMAVPLVTVDTVPKNNKERLEILKTMQAHAQFCLSGDHTTQAAKHSVKEIAKEDADEHFVILLSDANLERYGIQPKVLADAFATEPDVRSYAIFIGSLGNQADRLTKSLPAGKAFTCLELSKLPQIMQQVFTSAVLT